jgi:diacylglycerol kinase (ATP)
LKLITLFAQLDSLFYLKLDINQRHEETRGNLRMKKLLFVINPISGAIRKVGIPGLINTHINRNVFNPEVYFTSVRGDAVKKADQAHENKTDIIVAVGGDGTINEIAGQLIGSQTAMGIIPLGSGNGIARHLGIPLDPEKAMKKLNSGEEYLMDAAYINGQPFFNVAGIGFDAYVSHLFSKIPKRGFSGYIKATWKGLKDFRPFHVKITSGDVLYEGKAFILSFANTSQFGNNCYINPDGITHDGKIEIVLFKPFPKWATPLLVYQLFSKKIKKSRYVKTWSLSEATIETRDKVYVQKDGDAIDKMDKIEIKVAKGGLRVIR